MDLFSLKFLILLLVTFVAYYALFAINKIAKRTIIPQWSVLLISSLIFYGFSNYIYLIYLGISFLVSYVAALLCQYKLFKVTSTDGNQKEYELSFSRVESHSDRRKYENFITAIAILINVGILATLKYYNFLANSANSIFHTSLTTYNFIIPLGISFYTFSLIAYNVDCCKRATKAETNPFKFLLFVSYFPKVLQGPISSYDKLNEDGLFSEHSFQDNNYLKSFYRISVGLIKKIAIANVLNLYVNASYANIGNQFGGSLFLTSLLYTIQLYCDFSGFADITIGVSGLFGIKLEENFDIPYISASISEFWRRWHITLGRWLKKYIYIPLGGNQVPIIDWIVNILIVWLVSGIWHGANWTFIVWGLYNGVLLAINGLPKQLKKQYGIVSKDNKLEDMNKKNKWLRIVSVVVTFLLVNMGWILFRSSSIKEAARFVYHMIQFWKPGSYSMFSDTSISQANWLFVLSFVFVAVLILLKIFTTYKDSILSKFQHPEQVKEISKFLVVVVFVSISAFVFLYLKSIGGGESSFIYFDF